MDNQFLGGDLPRIDYDAIEADGPMPALAAEAVRAEARERLEMIRDFIATDEFVAMLRELYALAPEERDAFVRRELLDAERLAQRGILPPEGMKIQRSQFGDNRPTIFCVAMLLSDNVRKVTYTFDSSSFAAV